MNHKHDAHLDGALYALIITFVLVWLLMACLPPDNSGGLPPPLATQHQYFIDRGMLPSRTPTPTQTATTPLPPRFATPTLNLIFQTATAQPPTSDAINPVFLTATALAPTPTQETGDFFYGCVATSALNVRRAPSIYGAFVRQLPNGTTIVVDSQVAADGYTWGRIASGIEGDQWVALNWVVRGDACAGDNPKAP